MIVLLLSMLLICVIVAAFVWTHSRTEPDVELNEASVRAAAELHAIRRRLEAAQFRVDTRAESARRHRELHGELDRFDHNSWSSDR